MRRLSIAFAAFLTLAPGSVGAETLQDAFIDAYWNNPSIDAARAELQALGETVPIANARRLPSLAIDANIRGEATLFSDPGSANDFGDTSLLGLRGSVPVYDGGATANAVSEARANVDAGYARLSDAEQTALLTAATAFFDILRDREIRDLAKSSLELLDEELEASMTRFEVGEVTITDVAQTRSRLAQARADLILAEGNLRNSAENYRLIVGRLPGVLKPPDSLPATPGSLDAAETDALARAPEVRAAVSAERAAVFAIRSALSGKLPTVSLNSAIDRNQANRGFSTDSTVFSLTLSLNAPIYQGGAVNAQVRQARAIARQRRAEYHAAVRDVRLTLNTAWQQIVTARAAIVAGEERARAAQIAFEGVREELLVGSRATIDVLDAERERLNARIALVRSVRDLNVASYQLLNAVGRLTPDHLGFAENRGRGAGLSGYEGRTGDGLPDDALTVFRFPWRP